MVPLQVQTLLDQPEGRRRLAKIDTLLIGGSPVSPELEARLQGLNNRIYVTYGMTETVSHIALRRLNGLEHSPYYRTLPGVKITIDENDCLIIDAPAIAKKPVHTTDIVRITNDGEFELRGRHDHVINSGGIKFSPEIIERKLAPLIGERFIISSIADRVLGEKLILIVESKRWDPLIIRQLESAIRERLTPYERPKMFFFLEAFPIAGNEKISRKAITETAMRSLQNESENAG
jgi:O-succinylbenzoic acid--CoA ligase